MGKQKVTNITIGKKAGCITVECGEKIIELNVKCADKMQADYIKRFIERYLHDEPVYLEWKDA